MTKSKTDMRNNAEIQRFPTIRRMRDFHVYDLQGNRYLDLYRLNGHALMGHKPGRIALVLKNMVSKGLFASYPSIYEERLLKVLRILLPDCIGFRIYRNMERLVASLKDLLGEETGIPGDPLYPGASAEKAAFWRPFLPETPAFPALIPVFAVSGDFFPWVVGFTGRAGEKAPPSDTVSPALLAMLTRSVYDLLAFGEGYNENSWKKFPLPFWQRKGPYLLFSGNEKEYRQVFKNCREHGILIAPEAGKPSIIPGEWTDGEIQFLRKG